MSQEPHLALRGVAPSDLESFFQHQRDQEATQMAGFESRDRPSFFAHWEKILADQTVQTRTVLIGEEIVGNLVCWKQGGRSLIGYWFGRAFWGRGIASRALMDFLALLPPSDYFAYVSSANKASRRVLEKCGFFCLPEGEESSDGRECLYHWSPPA